MRSSKYNGSRYLYLLLTFSVIFLKLSTNYLCNYILKLEIIIFQGSEYQDPEEGECCGECKQRYCIVGDMLYKPNVTWTSTDNCTRFECVENGDQVCYHWNLVN